MIDSILNCIIGVLNWLCVTFFTYVMSPGTCFKLILTTFCFVMIVVFPICLIVAAYQGWTEGKNSH